MKVSRIWLLTAAAAVMLLAVTVPPSVFAEEAVSKRTSIHVIVIDAGSTGTRLNYYIFDKSDTAPFKLVLNKVVTRETEPGLSSYADNPSGAYKSIVELIKDANVSPDGADLLVKATAGVRLLARKNKKLAESIMNSVYEHLQATYKGTLRVWPGGVSILSGIREGDFGWLALHFLSTKDRLSHSHGVMDMGGASTQITFEYNNYTKLPESLKNMGLMAPDDYFSTLPALGQDYNLYSHSYLGLGINAARIFSLNVSDYCLLHDCTEQDALGTPCLDEKFTTILRSGPSAVRVKGMAVADPKERFSLCQNTMTNVVKMVLPVGDKKKLFPYLVLRSGFYYTFASTGLVPKEGGYIKLKQIKEKAAYLCENVVAVGRYAPYNCMNYNYLLTLLHDGYGFAWNQTFRCLNKVNGLTPDWAMGLAVKEAYAHFYYKAEEEEIEHP